jgi:hypothetical protein
MLCEKLLLKIVKWLSTAKVLKEFSILQVAGRVNYSANYEH